jgi:hypothetical protein
MGIPIVLVFSWIGFSLLMLKIRYLPALEWNIFHFNKGISSEKPMIPLLVV